MEKLTIGGVDILPGETKRIELPMPLLYTNTQMSIPVHVQRGKRPGPTLFVSSAIHGDELNGIENSRSFIKKSVDKKFTGYVNRSTYG